MPTAPRSPASLRRRLIGLAVLGIAALAPAPALAGGKADARAQARTLADKGFELSQQGRYQEAADAFQKAEQLFHAPTLLLELARTKLKLGRLVDAREIFQRVADEKLPPGAPAEFGTAQTTARSSVAELDARIPKLTIVVSGAAGKTYAVTIDDAVVARAALEHAIQLDPGDHEVTVLGDGTSEKRPVKLVEGARETVTLALAGSPPPAGAAPPRAPEAPPPHRDLFVPALVSFGVGAVGLGVGTAFGVDALSRAGKVKPLCPRDVCRPLVGPDVAAARTSATVSTAAFVIGGVGAAAGLTLILLRRARSPAVVGLVIGPGNLGAEGAF